MSKTQELTFDVGSHESKADTHIKDPLRMMLKMQQQQNALLKSVGSCLIECVGTSSCSRRIDGLVSGLERYCFGENMVEGHTHQI